MLFNAFSVGFEWQLCSEVTSLGSELSLARGEGQRNEVALEEAGRSRAELARDKAALVVQLTASERENAVLSEELASFRCVLPPRPPQPTTVNFSFFSYRPLCVCSCVTAVFAGQRGSLWKPACSKCSSSSFRWSLAESSWRRRTRIYESAVRRQLVSKRTQKNK